METDKRSSIVVRCSSAYMKARWKLYLLNGSRAKEEGCNMRNIGHSKAGGLLLARPMAWKKKTLVKIRGRGGPFLALP